MTKIKSFEIYIDDTDEDKVLVGNDLNTALEILENNGYIVEAKYEEEADDIKFVEYKSYTIRIEQSAETDGNLHIHVWDTENWKEDGDWIDRFFIEKGRI